MYKMTETARNNIMDDVSHVIWGKSYGMFADGIRSYVILHVEPAFIDDIYTLLDEQIKENLNYEDY